MSKTENKRAFDRFIPWLLLSLFIPVFIVNFILVRYALSTNTGLVDNNTFDKGKIYDQIISSGKKQLALGWTAKAWLTSVTEEGYRGRIVVTISDANGQPVPDLVIHGILVSPVDPRPDQILALSEISSGHFVQEVSVPRPGQWEIRLVATKGDNNFTVQQRLYFQ